MSLVVDVAVMFCVMCDCSIHRNSVLCYVAPRGKQYTYIDWNILHLCYFQIICNEEIL